MKKYSVIVLVLFISIFVHGCSGGNGDTGGTVNYSDSSVIQRNTVEGEVIDASNTDELADVTVTLGDSVVKSNEKGEYQFTSINSGTYVVTATKSGFETYTGKVTVGADGQSVTVFDIPLYPPNYAGTVKGQITSGDTGIGLPGVNVSIEEISTITDTEGNYKIEKVPPSLHDIIASKSGYNNASADFTVTGGSSVTVNMVMYEASSSTPGSTDPSNPSTNNPTKPNTGKLTGIVEDYIKDGKIHTATMIGGASIVWKDKNTKSTDEGAYALDGITVGTQKVTASKAYYKSKSANVQIKARATVNYDFNLTQLQKEIRKKPYLIFTGENTSMIVTWQTFNTLASSKIQWGTTNEYKDGSETVKENSDAKDEHIFSYKIQNLKPATKIYYKVTVDKEVFTGDFRTPPETNSDSLVFYFYGDTRTQPFEHDAVIKAIMNNMDADTQKECHTVLLNGGDFVSRGLMENYWDDEYFNPDTTNVQDFLAKIPILGVVGNHECLKEVPGKGSVFDDKTGGKLYKKYWPYPKYPKSDRFYISYEYGPIHVAAVDVYVHPTVAPGEEEYNWLDNDLASTDKKWKIVMLHKPIYSCSDYSMTLDDDLHKLFKKHNVKMVLQSHAHYYSRVNQTTQGIQYVTSGAGGAPLSPTTPYNSVSAQYPIVAASNFHYIRFDVSGKTLNAVVIAKDGSVLDTFTINL